MERKIEKKGKDRREERYKVLVVLTLLFIEALFFVSLSISFTESTFAAIGQNVTVATNLTVGNAAPIIENITINGESTISLTANATTPVDVLIIITDYNGDQDIVNVSAEFFDNVNSALGSADDNNLHYTNSSCFIDQSYGDGLEANATCTFYLWYYANNQTWNASVTVIDNSSLNDTDSDVETINALLALELPERIDFGVVNATTVSDERVANVTNFGNVMFNLTLEGYAVSQGDNLAMNCSLGTSNISIWYERYNLTDSNASLGTDLSLAQFNSIYRNLTNSSLVRGYDLDYRQNDTSEYIDDTNSTYWRVYVPVGAAGSCSGNVIFGAVRSAES